MSHNHSTPRFPDHQEKIILMGNPNVGKSVIFNYLTGRYVTVSNYPGTTVELTHGKLLGDSSTLVLDTPGINNFIPSSEDEVVTRNILLESPDARVIQVGDSRNLDRTLLLSLQLKEMGIPFILCLNMSDEARERGIHIDEDKLSEILQVPVVKTVAIQHIGLQKLIPKLAEASTNNFSGIEYSPVISEGCKKVSSLIESDQPFRESLSLMILASDFSLNDWVHEHLSKNDIDELNDALREAETNLQTSVGNAITSERMRKARTLVSKVITREKAEESSFFTRLGEWSQHRFGGLAIGAVVLYLIYQFVGVFGAGILVDFFENTIFGNWLTPLVTSIVDTLLPFQFAHDLLVGDYGLLSMALSYSIAIVLPIVGTFFLAFGILEDSGYLPRLAVMMNKLFRMMGLNGKAVLPMVLGLGCDTMATMTTRILDSRKERLIVMLLLALGVPCSAQLGVILGMLAALSPAMTFLWVGCIVLVIFAVGFLSSKIISGKGSDFVLELPPMRLPKLSNIGVKTLARIEWYLREAVPLFFLGTFVLFILDKLTLLSVIERGVSPIVVGFLGLPIKATEAFLIGFLRRDYGAAGLYNLFNDQIQSGSIAMETQIQIVVSMITITLFMPCIANFFVIIKEQGIKVAMAISLFILPFSILVAGFINYLLRWLLL